MFLRTLKGLAALLGLYAVARLVFALSNLAVYQSIPFFELLRAFVIGLRFDASAISMLSLWFLPLFFFPWGAWHRQRWIIGLVRVAFTAVHALGMALNLLDVEFYGVTSRRLTRETVKDLQHDIWSQIPQVIQTYWLLIVIWLVTLWLLWRISKLFTRNHLSPLGNLLSILFFAALMGICIRGGIQPKVLHPAHANSYFVSTDAAELALNGPFSFIRKPGARKVTAPSYFDSYEAALTASQQPPQQTPSPAKLPANTNVIIFVVESLSAEHMGDSGVPSYTPFLAKLRDQDSAKFYGIANGQTSIEALAPVLLGIPSILPNSYIRSMYHSNRVRGIGSALKTLGYDSYFFHGGQKGTMYFDSYARIAGIENYYGLEDYPRPEHFDGGWGIYDHYFLDFMADKISKSTKPFLSVFFSLSSHPPYPIPPERQGKYPVGTLRIHPSLGYVDEAFSEFFTKYKNEVWFQNTLFVFTADHTQTPAAKPFMSVLGRKRIPVFFYHPKISLQKFSDFQKVVQQADIPLSVYDLLGHSELNLMPLVSSAFNPVNLRGAAMFRDNDGCSFQIEGGATITGFKFCPGQAESGPYDLVTDPWAQTALESSTDDAKAQRERSRARMQVFFQGIIENRFGPQLKGK